MSPARQGRPSPNSPWKACSGCAAPIQGGAYCEECAPEAEAQRPAVGTRDNRPGSWSPWRRSNEQRRFKRAMMERFGGRCAATGGHDSVFADLDPGVQCAEIDPARLDGHHGTGEVPDLLLCNEHHIQLDPYARRRK